MDFSYSQKHLAIRDQTARYVRSEINPLLDPDPTPEKFDRQLWKKCATGGFFELGIPDSYLRSGADDGSMPSGIGIQQQQFASEARISEHDLLTHVIALESFGYACDDNGLPFALTAHGCTVQQTLLQHGSDAQIKHYLPGSIAGDLIGAHAMTEADAGSDFAGIKVKAGKVEGGYRLNGEKLMITLAPVADFYILFATVNPAAGRWGLTAFLIDRSSDGLTASTPVRKIGLDSVPMGRIVLDNCFVPQNCRLGPEGAGAAIAQHSLDLERTCILASQVGQMQRQLEETLSYTRERKQFGQAIGQYQSVSNRLADMRLRLENARLLLYKTAWMRDQGDSTALESSMLKLLVSENFLASSMDAMRIHGGYSYVNNHPSGNDTRDALGGVLYAGTSDIQRNIIAGMLGLK